MSSPPSSQANPPICSCPYGTKGIFVYDSDESCSKDHLGIAHATYYTTNLNQAMVTILRKPDELECFFDDCEFVSATKHRLKEHLKGMHQFFATFTSSPSQISAHCDGNSTSQESGALDNDSDSDSDIDGNAYKDKPPPEAGPSRVDDDEFRFMDGDEIESAMADFDMSTLDDIVSDPLVQLKGPTPSTPASRTLEDIWHVKDQLLRILLHGHSAFKPFAAALKLSTFVCDRNDRACVEEVMQADRKNTPPYSWKDVKCTLDPKKNCALFSEAARKQAQNFLKSADDGLLSDPPRHALHYKMGVDEDGLDYFRCTHGTNSVESFHLLLRRSFGSSHASPQFMDALLCNIPKYQGWRFQSDQEAVDRPF
ncbi:hypothetical protein C8J57DRAFT_1543404 [Mycena rebaudengoi]|nr:hypothetical protein C8J57DRAFT_1543404 [Mycena rebaudengoi]